MQKLSLPKIFLLAVSALCVVSQLYIPIPLIAVFAKLFNVSASEAVWIGSAFGFAYASGFLVFGPLSDRFGRKTLLIPGLIVLGIVSLGVGFTASFDQMIVLRIIQGFVAATFAPAALAYISEQIIPEERALGIALATTGFMLAGILGQLYASQVAILLDWRWIFWLASLFYIFLGLAGAMILDEEKNRAQKVEPLVIFYQAIIKHLRNLQLIKAYLCAFVLLLAFIAMYTGLGPHLAHVYGLSTSDMFLIRTAGIPGMLLGPFTSVFIKKYGGKKVLIAGFIIAVVGILGEGLFANLIIIVFMSACFVAGVSISAPALIANIATTATTNKGAAISLYTFILFTGAALGSILADLLLRYGFKVLCLVIMALMMTSIAVFSIQPSSKK